MDQQVVSPRNKNLKPHLRFLDVSRDFKALDIIFHAWFHKNCLPNSARAAIPTPLFSDRLIVIAHRILHPKDDRAATLTTPVTLERVGISNSNGVNPPSFVPRSCPLHHACVKKSAAPTVRITRRPDHGYIPVCGCTGGYTLPRDVPRCGNWNG